MWWLTAIDGPFPIGDIIYGVGLVACLVVDVVNYYGANNIAFLVSEAPNAIGDFINSLGSSASSNPPPEPPRFSEKTFGRIFKNLQAHAVKGKMHIMCSQSTLKTISAVQGLKYTIHSMEHGLTILSIEALVSTTI